MTEVILNMFTPEIEAMLHAFGDIWKPLPQTVVLVESVLHRKLCNLLQRATNVAEIRESSSIGMEEFVFLLHCDRARLIHFMQHAKFKDLKTSLSRNLSSDELEAATASIQEDGQTKQSKRYNVCSEFLQDIDNKGGYIRNSLGDSDMIRITRQERAEKQTRHMSSEEYVRFAQCRQVTFSSRMNKFCEWFNHLLPFLSLQPNASGWEALSFLAHETVGEIVDLCLLVQREQQFNKKFVSDPGTSTSTTEPCSATERGRFREELALKPRHVREALRRNPYFFNV